MRETYDDERGPNGGGRSEPSAGRFLTTDPLSALISDPLVSRYVYANNRPTVLADPSGLRPEHISWWEDLLANPIDLWKSGFEITPMWLKISDGILLFVSGGFVACYFSGVAVCVGLGGTVVGGGSTATQIGQATLRHFERQLAQHGVQSLLRSRESLTRQVQTHLQKIADAKLTGGFTSHMETEVRTFMTQIRAIDQVLRRHGY